VAKISTTLLKTDQALTFLDEVASQCHGSGMFEGRSGGFGRIGMIDGKPVKFNTHWKERLFGEKATAEMRDSCNQLRKSLYDVAKFVGLDFATLQRLCKGLGMKVERNEQVLSDGTMFQLGVNMEIVDKGLLDRKVVAKFVNELRQGLGASTTPAGIRSGSDMRFSTVSAQARADVRFERTVRMMSFCIADTLMEQGVELPMSPKALRDELAVSKVFRGLANFAEVKDVPTTLTDMVNWTMAKVNLDAREDESGKKLAAALKDDFEIMLDRAGLIDRSRNLRPESLFEWAHGGYVDNKNSIYACPSETRKPTRFKAWRNKFAESLKEKLNVTQEALDSAA